MSRRNWWLVLVVVVAGCARVAFREDGRPGRSRCPVASEVASRLGSGSSSGNECELRERCVEGDFVCRCDAARGGADRPNWWTCHRAQHKLDGCPDDAVLLAGAACSREGQACLAPRACECSFFTSAICTEGRWLVPSCGPCLAP